MQATKRLTRFSSSQEFGAPTGVDSLLAAVGLELWQAPQGFWAVRLKPATGPVPVARMRGRALRRTK
jgi:hypothetical protein